MAAKEYDKIESTLATNCGSLSNLSQGDHGAPYLCCGNVWREPNKLSYTEITLMRVLILNYCFVIVKNFSLVMAVFPLGPAA